MKFVRYPRRKVTFKRRPKRKVSPSKKKASAVASVKVTERQPSRDPFFTAWWHAAAEKQAERQRDCNR